MYLLRSKAAGATVSFKDIPQKEELNVKLTVRQQHGQKTRNFRRPGSRTVRLLSPESALLEELR